MACSSVSNAGSTSEETTSHHVSTPNFSSGASSSTKESRVRSYSLKKLLKKIEIYSRQIRKFNEESLNFAEMDLVDSAYMKVDALQKKLVKTWEEYCRLQKMSPEIVVNYNNVDGYAGTEYVELNRKINRLLSKCIDTFPDYLDICTMVSRCNTKYNLMISTEKQSTLSRRVFQEVIKELKRRRQRDFIHHFGSHLTDECIGTTDPATNDKELSSKLESHQKKSVEAMTNVIEEFIAKQEAGVQPEPESEDEAQESELEDEAIEEEEDKRIGSDQEEVQNSFEISLKLECNSLISIEESMELAPLIECSSPTPSCDEGDTAMSNHTPSQEYIESEDSLPPTPMFNKSAKPLPTEETVTTDLPTNSTSTPAKASNKKSQRQPSAQKGKTTVNGQRVNNSAVIVIDD